MNQQKSGGLRSSFAMLGNPRVLVASALLAAMSFILGKFLQIPNPFSEIFRLSLENMPVIMAGVCFGPAVGGMVGAVADIVGCLLYGYAINPIVTLGAATVGISSGVVSHFIVKRPLWLSVAASALVAHALGSVAIKSMGLAAWYLSSYNMGLRELILWRTLLYAFIGTVEVVIIYILLRHKAVARQILKIKEHKK